MNEITSLIAKLELLEGIPNEDVGNEGNRLRRVSNPDLALGSSFT